ncbi:MAG: mechanosensitive ion channel [Candidatus Omnitrophica bacterium]|nr:mechanosensitive ion channel [Candidatus Omnitrophota bacterium]
MSFNWDMVNEFGLKYGVNLVWALVIFLIGKILARVIARFLEKVMRRSNLDATLISFLKELVYFGILAFVIIAALNQLGVQTTSIVAIVGAAGLAIGLALQGSLSNFAAGVMIIILKPFRLGDAVQAGGVTGEVKEIKIFNTLIATADNQHVMVPNSKIINDNIVNLSAVPYRRIDMVFGISYNDNIKLAKDILMQVMLSNPNVLKDPAPMVAVSELAESSVNLVCRPWAKPSNYWAVLFDITERAKIELEKNGITLPYPQREIHIKNKSEK